MSQSSIVDLIIRRRYVLLVVSVLACLCLAYGGKFLYFAGDYKIFFNKDDAQLLAYDRLQTSYTSSDNLTFLIKAENPQGVFTPSYLHLIQQLTERAWQTPYVVRVDSISNYQHTAVEGDDLLVADLVPLNVTLDATLIGNIRSIALNELQLHKRLVSTDGKTTSINVSLELPQAPKGHEPSAEQRKMSEMRDHSSVEVVTFANHVADEIRQQYPELEIHLLGVPVMNQSFNGQSKQDMQTLIPLVYVMVAVMLMVFLRSFFAVVGALTVIAFATMAAVGAAGWLGLSLNIVNSMAPTIILSIAVCDSVHVLSIYLRELGRCGDPLESMRESVRINLEPVFLTSVTTAVGFLTLNFSVSPPFRELGNITAIGVIVAMVLTFTVLPTIIIALVHKSRIKKHENRRILVFSRFVVRNARACFIGGMGVAVLLLLMISLNRVNDDPILYFDRGIPLRDAADFTQKGNLPGIKDLNFSIDCGQPDCVYEPIFLHKLKSFVEWLEQQADVEFVGSYIDVIRRINRNMNSDDPAFYRIPDTQELAAQYHLLYEMSLPLGLDLNNQVNFDKSATRLNVMMRQVPASEIVDIEQRAHQWLVQNYPELATHGASVNMMFAKMSANNIRSMFWGVLFAIIGVTLTLLVSLRSLRYALLSLIPNAFPSLMALGLWGLIIGHVNMAVAAIFSLTLGIVVDDTVHFIAKYRRAIIHKGFNQQQAIDYAFENVGRALIITTLVLSLGFGVLMFSDFGLNSDTGALVAMTIVIALVFDFFVLPPLLLFFSPNQHNQQS